MILSEACYFSEAVVVVPEERQAVVTAVRPGEAEAEAEEAVVSSRSGLGILTEADRPRLERLHRLAAWEETVERARPVT